ncbi:hypothetical protein [Geoalkalibacter sp.]|uniref:hypothetical protein n=1 Tax=Geoalkalibacter sp. TaxID=3041440 RepID=UPI00272E3B21|nr:hypothetical protein [Geoalkalibacter sp.]
MGKQVEHPKNAIVSARLDGGEQEDFARLVRIFGSRSEVVRMGLKMLAATAGIDFGKGDFRSDDDAAA